jgi:hypothetical protein
MRIAHTYVGSVKNKKPADISLRPIPQMIIVRTGSGAMAEAAATREKTNQRVG